MKFSALPIILILLPSIVLKAQQNHALRGKMLFLNSGKKPAIGVEISGSILRVEKATSTYTTEDGSYELLFPNSRVGHSVDLNIGSTDSKGASVELVNDKEVRICRIPANPSDQFEIIVCRKGQRDEIAQAYYKIIKTSADKALAKKEEEYNELHLARQKDYERIATLSTELIELQKQVDSVAIYKEALRIASINKDNASDRMLKYIGCIEDGGIIQDCLSFLNEQEATKEGKKGVKNLKQSIEELETKASSAAFIFNYNKAITCYDSILAIMHEEKEYINPLKIADFQYQLSRVLHKDGQFNKSLNYQQKCIETRESFLPEDDLSLASSYNFLLLIFESLGKSEEALTAGNKALEIREKHSASAPEDLATSYLNLALPHKSLGDYEKALENEQKALEIRKALLDTGSVHLANIYQNLSVTHYTLGQFEKSIETVKLAIQILERNPDASKFDLAMCYSSLGTTYDDLNVGRHEEALNLHEKALKIRTDILHSNHPELGSSYNNIAISLLSLGRIEEALSYCLKSVVLREKILPPKHPNLAISYNNLAYIYKVSGDLEKALEFEKKCIEIEEETLGADHPSLATSYNNIAITHARMKDFNTALEFLYKSVKIREKTLDANHPSIVFSYYNMGNMHMELNDYEKALECFEKCELINESGAEIQPGILMKIYRFIAKMHSALNNQNESLFYYDKSIVIADSILDLNDPMRAELFTEKAQVLTVTENCKESLELFNKAVKIQRENADTMGLFNSLKQQAVTYAKCSDFDAAKELLNEYEKKFPNTIQTYKNWAIYFSLKNDKDRSIEYLQKARKGGLKDLTWFEGEKALDNVRKDRRFRKIIRDLKSTQKN